MSLAVPVASLEKVRTESYTDCALCSTQPSTPGRPPVQPCRKGTLGPAHLYIHRTIHGVGYDPMNDGGVYRIPRQPVIPSEDSDFVQNCATDLEAHPSILHSCSYVVKTLPLSPCFTTSWCRQGMRPRFRWAASQRGTGRCGSTMRCSPRFEPTWAWVMVRPKHGNPGSRLTGTR